MSLECIHNTYIIHSYIHTFINTCKMSIIFSIFFKPRMPNLVYKAVYEYSLPESIFRKGKQTSEQLSQRKWLSKSDRRRILWSWSMWWEDRGIFYQCFGCPHFTQISFRKENLDFFLNYIFNSCSVFIGYWTKHHARLSKKKKCGLTFFLLTRVC